jgi:hypothetical protein
VIHVVACEISRFFFLVLVQMDPKTVNNLKRKAPAPIWAWIAGASLATAGLVWLRQHNGNEAPPRQPVKAAIESARKEMSP